MTLDEMERAAQAAIENRKRMRLAMGDPDSGYPFNSPAQLVLLLKRPEPRGNKVRLVGRSGPLGEFLCSPADGAVTAAFNAEDILAWVKKRRKKR